MDKITSFSGEYAFLSNAYPAVLVVHDEQSFINSEAAFQAAKCPERSAEFLELKAGDAMWLGRRVPLRPGWDNMKLDIMYEVCRAKFTQNIELMAKLLGTGDAELAEEDPWHETFWAVHDGVGENHLGKILMRLREELRPPRGCATTYLLNYANEQNYQRGYDPKFTAAVAQAVSALWEQEKKEKPLTLEQLIQMDGKPVYRQYDDGTKKCYVLGVWNVGKDQIVHIGDANGAIMLYKGGELVHPAGQHLYPYSE